MKTLRCCTFKPPRPAISTHVTDKLLAGMYSSPKTKGIPLKRLPSGTQVEVLERGKVFHKVRVEDGTEGWVNSAYLTEETPAKALLVEARARAQHESSQVMAAARKTESDARLRAEQILAAAQTEADQKVATAAAAAKRKAS